MVGCLLKFNHFQPHIFSRFIIHQQNREEKTLLQLHTKNFEEGVRALIRAWAHIFSKFIIHQQNKEERSLLQLHTKYIEGGGGGGANSRLGAHFQ